MVTGQPTHKREGAIADLKFPNEDLGITLAVQSLKLRKEIDSLSESRLRTADLEDLCNDLVEKHAIRAPEIDESRIRIDYGDAEVAVNARIYGDNLIWNYPVKTIGTQMVCYVPFKGDSRYFRLMPASADFHCPPAEVRDNELVFHYAGTTAESMNFPSEWKRDLDNLKRYLAWVRHSIESFNSSIRGEAAKWIRQRPQKLLNDRLLVRALGFPTRCRKSVASTDVSVDGPQDILVMPASASKQGGSREHIPDTNLFEHSPCYRSVRWREQDFRFTAMQAHALGILHDNYKRGLPDTSQQALLTEIESKSRRLRDIFRNSPAWKTLIVAGERRGTYRLRS